MEIKEIWTSLVVSFCPSQFFFEWFVNILDVMGVVSHHILTCFDTTMAPPGICGVHSAHSVDLRYPRGLNIMVWNFGVLIKGVGLALLLIIYKLICLVKLSCLETICWSIMELMLVQTPFLLWSKLLALELCIQNSAGIWVLWVLRWGGEPHPPGKGMWIPCPKIWYSRQQEASPGEKVQLHGFN